MTTGPDVPSPEEEEIRRLLHDLPEVLPPEGFYDDLIRRRHRRAHLVAGAAALLAVLAGSIVVGRATGITGRVDPVLGELAARHTTILTVDVRSLSGEMGGDAVPAPYQAPAQLGGFQRGMAVRHPDDVVQVMYADRGTYVSVFEQAGDMDDDDMADDLTPLEVRGVSAWRTPDEMVLVRRDDVVYVLVGDLSDKEIAAVVVDLPDARRLGLSDRLQDAMDDLVSAFGLD